MSTRAKSKKAPRKKKAAAKRPAKKGAAKKKNPKTKASSRRSRWLLVIGLLLLAWPLGRIALAVATEKIVEDLSGFDAAVGGVSFADGGRRVTLRDLRLRHPARYGRFVDIDEIEVPFREPLWRDRGEAVGTVRVTGLRVRVFPGDLKDRPRSEPPAPTPSPRGPREESPPPAPRPAPPKRLEVRDGRIELALPRGEATPFILAVDIPFLNAVSDGNGGWRIAKADARLLGGHLRLEGARDRRGHWDLDARLAGADLAAHPAAAGLGVNGALNAALQLRSRGEGPEGAGWIDLRRGVVWELPLLSDLVAALGLAAGQGDLVRQARGQFHLEAGRLSFSDLHLRGTPLSLWGRGDIAFESGEVRVDMVPRLMEGMTGDLPLVGEPTQLLLDLVGGAAVQVRLRGTLDAPELRADPIPLLGDPLREAFETLGVR